MKEKTLNDNFTIVNPETPKDKNIKDLIKRTKHNADFMQKYFGYGK